MATKPRSKRRKFLSAGKGRNAAATRCRLPRDVGRVNLERVERTRRLIEAGVYLTPERVELAVFRLIDSEAERWVAMG